MFICIWKKLFIICSIIPERKNTPRLAHSIEPQNIMPCTGGQINYFSCEWVKRTQLMDCFCLQFLAIYDLKKDSFSNEIYLYHCGKSCYMAIHLWVYLFYSCQEYANCHPYTHFDINNKYWWSCTNDEFTCTLVYTTENIQVYNVTYGIFNYKLWISHKSRS